MHIFSNMISQLILGFMLESILGPMKIAALYIVSGIGGNAFSCLCSNSRSVGASTAIFGLIGGLLAMIIVNWKALDRNPEIRCCMIVFIVFFLVFSILFSYSSDISVGNDSTNNVDIYGHIGGFLTGTFFGMIIMN